jgi:hypothetical protein
MTRSDILDRAHNYGIPEAEAIGLFESVNKNGDAWICLTELPGDDPGDVNVIDNQAIGRDQ